MYEKRYVWTQYIVHLPTIEKWLRTNYLDIYLGNVATDEIFTLYFSSQPTEQQLDDIKNCWDSHNSPNPPAKMFTIEDYMSQVEQGMDFGRRLMIEFNAMNVERNMSTTQVKYLAYSLQAIQGLLMNSSIYSAREEAMKLTPIEGILLPEDIDYFLNKMDNFLYERDGYYGYEN